jgi:hypothetical protein
VADSTIHAATRRGPEEALQARRSMPNPSCVVVPGMHR